MIVLALILSSVAIALEAHLFTINNSAADEAQHAAHNAARAARANRHVTCSLAQLVADVTDSRAGGAFERHAAQFLASVDRLNCSAHPTRFGKGGGHGNGGGNPGGLPGPPPGGPSPKPKPHCTVEVNPRTGHRVCVQVSLP
jgi:hypothetical protein